MDDTPPVPADRSLVADIYDASVKALAEFGTKNVVLSLLTRVAILERQVLNLHDRTKSLESAAISPAASNLVPDEPGGLHGERAAEPPTGS